MSLLYTWVVQFLLLFDTFLFIYDGIMFPLDPGFLLVVTVVKKSI